MRYSLSQALGLQQFLFL